MVMRPMRARFGDRAAAQITTNPKLMEGLKVGGEFVCEHYRNGELLGVSRGHNIVTAEGIEYLLNCILHGGTQIDPWSCAIYETNTAVSGTMTYAAPVNTESTAYDEGGRPTYTEAAASSGTVTNSANKAVFTMNATKTIYGAGLVGGGSSSTVFGDTAGGGVLLCQALFGSSRAVVDDDVINLTYAFTGADDAV